MNRMISAVFIGLACTACATYVEDAQPEPEEAEPQRSPPKQPLSSPWEDPYSNLVVPAGDFGRDLKVPILKPPHFPDPDPNVER